MVAALGTNAFGGGDPAGSGGAWLPMQVVDRVAGPTAEGTIADHVLTEPQFPTGGPPVPPALAEELFGHIAPPIRAQDLAGVEAEGAEKKAAIVATLDTHTQTVGAHVDAAEQRISPAEKKEPPPTKEGLDARLLADQEKEEADLEASKDKALADLDARIAQQKKLMDGTVLPGDATSDAERELTTQTDAEKAALQKTYLDGSLANTRHMGEALKAGQDKADKQADQLIADAEVEAKGIENKGEFEGARTQAQYFTRSAQVMIDAQAKASALSADEKPQSQIDTLYRDAGAASAKLIQDGIAAKQQVIDRAKADADALRNSAKEKANQHKGATGAAALGTIQARNLGLKTEADQLGRGKSALDKETGSSTDKVRADAEDGRKKQRATEAATLKKMQDERRQLADRLDKQIEGQKQVIAKRTEWMRKSVASASPAALPQLAKSVKWCGDTQDGTTATIDKSAKAQVDMAGQRMKTEAGQTLTAMAAQGKAAMALVDADVAAARQRIAAVGQQAQSQQRAVTAQVAASIDGAENKAQAQDAARAASLKKGLLDQAEACKQDVTKTGETMVKEDADRQLKAAEGRTQDIADKDWARMQAEAEATEKELERKCGKFVTDSDGIRDLYRECAGDPDKLAMLKKAAADKGVDLDAIVGKAMDKSASSMLRHLGGEGLVWSSDTLAAEKKELNAYSRGDLDTADVAIFQQGDRDRCDKVVEECKEGKNGQNLEKLSNDIEEQTGTKASEMMKENLSPEKNAEVAGTVACAEIERKQKQKDFLAAAVRAELKGKSPEEQNKIKEDAKAKAVDLAGKLNAVLNRKVKVGNDYKTTDLLVGLSPSEIVALKEQYKAANYGDLDDAINDNMSGTNRKAAKAALSGDPVAAAESLVEQSADGDGTNTELWQKAMETLKTPEQRAAFKARIEKHTGMTYTALNKSENSGYDRDTMDAEAIEDNDQRVASLAGVKLASHGHTGKLQALVDGVGDTVGDDLGESDEARNKRRQITNQMVDAADRMNPLAGLTALSKWDQRKSGEGYIDNMDGLSEKQMALLDKDVQARTGKSLTTLNHEQLEGHALEAADAFAANDRIGGKAQSMLAAGDHIFNDDEDKMSKGFELNPADYEKYAPEDRAQMMQKDRDAIRARMAKDPEVIKAGGVDAYYKSQLDATQRQAASERMADGKVSDVTEVLMAGDTTLGFGKDTGKLTEVLAKLKPGDGPGSVGDFDEQFRKANHGQSIKDFLASKATSDGERRDFAMLAEGNPAKLSDEELARDPNLMIDRIKKLHEAARGGVEGFHPIDNLGNAIGNEMADLETNTGKILDKRYQRALALEKRMEAGEKLSEDETRSLVTDMRAMSSDKEGFVDAKNEVVNDTADVVSTGVELGVDAVTGNDKLGTLVGGLTKIEIKQTLNGARYGTDEMAQDVMQIAVSEAGAFGGAKFGGGLAKEVLVGAAQGGLSAAIDFKNMRDLGDLVTSFGKGMEAGGIGALTGAAGKHFGGDSALGAGMGAAANDVLTNDDASWQTAGRAGAQAWAAHHANAHAKAEEAKKAAQAAEAAKAARPGPAPEEAPVAKPAPRGGANEETPAARPAPDEEMSPGKPVVRAPAPASEVEGQEAKKSPQQRAIEEMTRRYDDHEDPRAWDGQCGKEPEALGRKLAAAGFHGDIVAGSAANGTAKHFYVRMPDGTIVDPTFRQFFKAPAESGAMVGAFSGTKEELRAHIAEMAKSPGLTAEAIARYGGPEGMYKALFDGPQVKVSKPADLLFEFPAGSGKMHYADSQTHLDQMLKAGGVRAPAPTDGAPAADDAAKEHDDGAPVGYTRYGDPVYPPGHPSYEAPKGIWQDTNGDWHESGGDMIETRTEARVRDARSRMVGTGDGQRILQHFNGEGANVEITMEPGKGSFREGDRINIDPNHGSEAAGETLVHEGEHHRTFDRDVYDDANATPAERAQKALRNEAEATAAQAEHASQKGQEAHPVAETYLGYRDEALDRLRDENPEMSERQLRLLARAEATDRLAGDFKDFKPSTSYDGNGDFIPGKPKNYQEHYEQAFAEQDAEPVAAPAPDATQLAAQARKRPPDVDAVQAAEFEKDGYHWRQGDGEMILVAPKDGVGMMVEDGQIVPREEKPIDFPARELDGERLSARDIPAEPSGPDKVSVQEGVEGQVKRRESWRKAEEELQARYDAEVKRDPNGVAAQVMKDDLDRRQSRVNMASRRVGEGSAILFMRERARQLGLPPEAVQLVYGGWDHASRNGDLDLVFELGGKHYVVEAKGGTSELGAADIKSGADVGKRAEQGSREYLDHTLAEMEARATRSGDLGTLALVAHLRDGLAGKTLQYEKVRARFEEDANGDQRLRDIIGTRFDIYGDA